MKRKFISILLISSVLLSSFIFIGCKEEQKVEANNNTNTNENQDTNTEAQNKEIKSSTSKEEAQKKEDVINNTKKKTVYTEESHLKDSKSDTALKNNNEKPLTKGELAKKIMKIETSKNMTATPVNVTNPGKNFSYTKASESSLYYCKEGKFNPEDLSSGFIIDFFGEAKDGSYQFKITSYDMIKDGGSGTVDSGTAYPNGNIVMNH